MITSHPKAHKEKGSEMKKLHMSSRRVRNNKRSKAKGAVHPLVSAHLSFLPATILALAAALSADDREVLSYLISYNKSNGYKDHDHDQEHGPLFSCRCFRCYMSYWARWDKSPNHSLIHQIIDSLERPALAPDRPEFESISTGGDGDHDGHGFELGSIRKIVKFIGDKIWGL